MMSGAGEAGAGPAIDVKSAGLPMKRKAVEGEGSYAKGAIVRVRLQNIQVCSDVEVFPGPGLNLVVGPNGAGKSTIVAGIFLCLGGDHKLLRRHERVGDYVKSKPKQEPEGRIEVELCGGDGPNVTVSRRLKAGKIDKKDYTINGKSAKESEVHRLATSLNIHMENLCQFLPQDRVSEFADMNPQQILRATEEAVGGQEMLKMHDDIHKLGIAEREMDAKVNDKIVQETSLTKQRDNLQKSYDRYKHRQEQKERHELLVKKLAWSQYNVAYEEFNKHKLVEKEKKEMLQAAMEALGPEQKEKDEMEQKIKSLRKDFKDARGSMTDAAKETEKLKAKFDAAEERFDDAVQDSSGSGERIDTLKRKAVANAAMCADLENQIANTSAVDVSEELKAAKDAVREHTDRHTVTERLERRLKMEKIDLGKQTALKSSTLKQLESGSKQLENKIKGSDRELFSAMTWLRANTDKFRMEVFEPIVMQLQVSKPVHAKYIEQSIPKRELQAFVTQCKEDNDFFFSQMQEQRLRVNIVQTPANASPSPIRNAEGIAELGAFSVLSDLVTGPEPVMRYLNKFSKLNGIVLLEGADGGKHASTLFYKHNVARFFTGGNMCTTSKSKHGNQTTSNSFSSVRSPKFLTETVDQRELVKIKAELGELKKSFDRNATDHSAAKHEDAEARAAVNEAVAQLKRVKETHNELNVLRKKLKRSEEKTAQLQSQINSEETKQKSAAGKVKQKATLLLTLALQQKQLVLQMTDSAKTVFEAGLAQAQTEKELQALTDSLKDKMSEIREFEIAHADAKAYRKVLKAQATKLLEEAQKKIDGRKAPDEVPGLIEAFQLFPNDPSELDALIAEEVAKLDCTTDADGDIVADYESVVEKISKLQESLEKDKEYLEMAIKELEEKKTTWMPKINEITTTVSEKFAEMFANIGHVGEVSLFEHEHDYSQYGLEIRVSFKSDGKLHQLKGSFQSGGEKMVSTMIFLLALQKLSSCPFRLVDEINQGMDQRNERRVFEQVVHCSESEGQSQYFMVSPKLLPDLGYSSSMKVIIIFSGPWLKSNEWDVSGKRSMISKAIAKKRRILAATNA